MDSTFVSYQAIALARRHGHVTRHAPIPRRLKAKANGSLSDLLAIGAADPGQILLPTSDETAWLYAENAASSGSVFPHRSTLDCDPAAHPGQEAFCGCRDQRGACGVAELGPTKHRRCRGVGADLALSDPYKAAHACSPPQERQGGSRPFRTSELINQYQRFVDREQARAADDPLFRRRQPAHLAAVRPCGERGRPFGHGVYRSDGRAVCYARRNQGVSAIPTCGSWGLL